MLHEPRLLLLDEPTAGVDPQARREFWEELHRLASEGLTVLVTTHYMDEAERCHRLAFILAGRLLTQGTNEEIVAGSGLSTWAVSGPELPALQAALRAEPGVEQAAAFGNDLHVSGGDAAALADAVAKHRTSRHRWRQVESSLEDVFIHLMSSGAGAGAGTGR
jgi:ABC-2 type transport system ATP-binding protein